MKAVADIATVMAIVIQIRTTIVRTRIAVIFICSQSHDSSKVITSTWVVS